MKNDLEKIPPNLIMAIIIHIYFGWGFLYLVDVAVSHLTNNAYLGILSASAVILPFFWIAGDLARMYPNQKISAIFGEVFGKYGGKVVGVIFECLLIFFLVIAQRNTQLMVYSYFFRKTPFFLITLFFLAGALYIALKGLNSVGRLAAFMLIPPLVLIFGLGLLGLHNIDLLNVQPILAGSFKQWLATSLDLPLTILPGTAIFVFLPYIRSNSRTYPHSALKISLVALGIVLPVFFVVLLGTIGVFGPAPITKMSWSLVEYFRYIDYPYLLLEQSGLFFLIAWYPFHFVGTAQGLLVIGNELNVIFPRISRKWYSVIIAVLVLFIVNLPINIVSLGDLFRTYREWITYFYLSLLLGTWLIARLRFGKKKISHY